MSPAIGLFIFIPLIIELTIAVLVIAGWVQILKKAGYSGWWALIGLVPLVNLVMFLVFAFGDWPSLRRSGPNQRYGSGPYGPHPVASYGVGPMAGAGHPVLDGWSPTPRAPGNDGAPPWGER